MRHPSLLLVIAILGTAPAPAATQIWTSQIGILGGFARTKPAGTGQRDHLDQWDLPGAGAPYPTVFVVIPIASRVALETAISAAHTSSSETGGLLPNRSISNVRYTLRTNVALTGRVYVAAGGTLRYAQLDDVHQVQAGVVGAMGYLHPVGRDLTARIEAQWIARQRTDSISPSTTYALLLGFSHRLRRSPVSSAPARPWKLSLGMAGGFVRSRSYGSVLGFDVDFRETGIHLPASGSMSLPSLFAIVPLLGKLALETGFEAHRTQREGTTLFDGHLSTRLDVAVYRGGYIAGGGNVRYIEQTGSAGFAFAGASVATGYRFPLAGSLDGRLEVSFTAFKERANFPFAQNALAVLVGVTMPLQ